MNQAIKSAVNPQVVQVLETDEIAQAFHAMRNAKTRTALVINAKGEITGVLGERDLERAIDGKIVSSSSPLPLFEPSQKVLHFKSGPVRVVSQNQEIKHLCQDILNDGLAAVLLESEGTIHTIVTTEDLLRAIYRLLFEKSADRKNELEKIFFSLNIGQFAEQKSRFFL